MNQLLEDPPHHSPRAGKRLPCSSQENIIIKDISDNTAWIIVNIMVALIKLPSGQK